MVQVALAHDQPPVPRRERLRECADARRRQPLRERPAAGDLDRALLRQPLQPDVADQHGQHPQGQRAPPAAPGGQQGQQGQRAEDRVDEVDPAQRPALGRQREGQHHAVRGDDVGGQVHEQRGDHRHVRFGAGCAPPARRGEQHGSQRGDRQRPQRQQQQRVRRPLVAVGEEAQGVPGEADEVEVGERAGGRTEQQALAAAQHGAPARPADLRRGGAEQRVGQRVHAARAVAAARAALRPRRAGGGRGRRRAPASA